MLPCLVSDASGVELFTSVMFMQLNRCPGSGEDDIAHIKKVLGAKFDMKYLGEIK